MMLKLLQRFGLHCSSVEDERVFADGYLLRTVGESQLFMVLSALTFYVFFFWDRMIDPVNWNTTHMIRGLLVAPAMVLVAGVLFTPFGKRHFEAFVLTMLLLVMAGLATIYAVLDHGYQYAALAFTMAMLGTTTMFPIRSRFLVIGSFLSMVIVVVGHLLAHNAGPGWLLVNLMAALVSIGMGTLSAYLREREARAAFRATKALVASRERVDELLHSMLPREVVQRIQAGETAIADLHGEVSIIFADLAGFTEMSRKISPSHLVRVLNDLFSSFDRDAERLGIERIKTIGDAYMAIGGLRRSVDGTDHVEAAALFALAIQARVLKLVSEMEYPLQIRVGLHVGPVVAGVIGVTRPAFDCWGESVNLASRIEGHATPGTILVSESAYWRLKPFFEMDPQGDTDLKGIGKTRVFRLLGPIAGETLEAGEGVAALPAVA